MADRFLMQIDTATSGVEAGQWLWGAPEWTIPAALIVVVLASLVIWNYAQRGVLAGIRVTAGLLKLAAIVLLAICLLQPLRSGTRPRPNANLLPILVDNSQSMRLKPADNSTLIGSAETRGEMATAAFDDDATWKNRLAQTFDVRTYSFDSRLESIDDPQALPMDGHVSSLFGGLQSLKDRFADRAVGSVLLFTDGNMTDKPAADFDWSQLGFPVYAVLPEKEEPVRDLRIADVSVQQTDFESAPLTVRVMVDSVAMDATNAVVQLRDASTDRIVEEQKITIGSDGETKEVSFRFRPESNGVQFFRVNVFREIDRAWFDDPDSSLSESNEATLINNRRIVAVNRAAGPYRVLYVSGRPNWEFKFIRRSLQEDAEVQLVGLLRIANKEPKFSFRDRGVNATNPLFAGLGDDAEDAAAQYDEPVMFAFGSQGVRRA